jgi:hypothetical protein
MWIKRVPARCAWYAETYGTMSCRDQLVDACLVLLPVVWLGLAGVSSKREMLWEFTWMGVVGSLLVAGKVLTTHFLGGRALRRGVIPVCPPGTNDLPELRERVVKAEIIGVLGILALFAVPFGRDRSFWPLLPFFAMTFLATLRPYIYAKWAARSQAAAQ